MRGEDVRNLFETIFPTDDIMESCRRLGALKRERVMDPVLLVRSMVMAGGSSECGRLAGILHDYTNRGGVVGARSGFYQRFNKGLLAVMKELSNRASEYVAAMPKHLPGILAGPSDWRVVDATTVKVPDGLQSSYPGCGDYGALKVHKEYSLGVENLIDYSITPARDHDAPQLKIDDSRRGTGLLVDLGYVSHDLFRQCEVHDVRLVVRLKKGWNFRLDAGKTGRQFQTWELPPEAVDAVEAGFDAPFVVPPSGIVDVDVTLGDGGGPPVRLVAMDSRRGRHVLLTNLPRETYAPEEVGMLYRLRWNIELDNKLSKQGCRLDDITTGKKIAADILVHASMIATMLANAIVHLQHLSEGAVGEKAVRFKHPPVHPINIWKAVDRASMDIDHHLRNPDDTDGYWSRLAGIFRRIGADPNWKSQPSALDRVKGRTARGQAWRCRRRRPVHEVETDDGLK